jgi:hypothetical protein
VTLLGEFFNVHGDLVEGFSCDGTFFVTFGAGRQDCSVYEFVVWNLETLTQIAVSLQYQTITSISVGKIRDGFNVVAVGHRDTVEVVQFRSLTRLERLVLDKAKEIADYSHNNAVEPTATKGGPFVRTRATLLDHTSNLHFFCLWEKHLDTSIK